MTNSNQCDACSITGELYHDEVSGLALCSVCEPPPGNTVTVGKLIRLLSVYSPDTQVGLVTNPEMVPNVHEGLLSMLTYDENNTVYLSVALP